MTKISHTRRTQSQSGFTLLEILVVTAIMGVVMSVGTTAFYQLTTIWNETKVLAELETKVDQAFGEILTDLADTTSSELSGQAIVGLNRETTNPSKHFDRVLANDLVIIPLQHTVTGVRRATGAKVSYHIVRTEESSALVRSIGDLTGDIPAATPKYLIQDADVIRFRVEYASAGNPDEWLPEWNEEYNPIAVRVSLALQDAHREYLQIARKAVFQINVK